MMDQTLCTMAPSVGGDHTDVVSKYNDAGSPGLPRSSGDSEQTRRRARKTGSSRPPSTGRRTMQNILLNKFRSEYATRTFRSGDDGHLWSNSL